jgi:ankyrin repeat protein
MSQQFLKLIQRGATTEVAEAVAADPSLVTCRDAQGVSALLWSIYSGQTIIRNFLLTEIARFGLPVDIFEASALGDPEELSRTLQANPLSVQACSGDGWTPLHLAAAFGSPQAVEILLKNGAAVDAVSTNPQKNQPLHAALALGRNPDTIALLLEAGADPNGRQTAGFTALFSAAAANRRDLVDLLIAHGADPNLQSDFGQTAATFARERSHTELADYLESLASNQAD